METETPETPLRPLPAHLSVFAGLLMGSADAVPGVSGGTIALILGVYERLVGSIASVVRLPKLVRTVEGRAELGAAFRFLLPLLIGILAAYYGATKLLVGPKDDPGWIRQVETAPICYAFFFGLVLASLREPWRRIASHGPARFLAAALGAAAAFVLVGLPYNQAEPETWMLLYGGALAVSVMLLPGVSGSLLLVVLGQYTTVAGALHDREFGTLGVFAAGVAIGVILFVPFLRFVLQKHHDNTMAVLTGLMAGSLRALWPWKSGYEPKLAEMVNVAPFPPYMWVIVAAIAGAATVLLLALLERRIERA